MADERNDPYRNFRYRLEIDGITEAGFNEVTMPDASTDPIEYRNGNETNTVRKLPGLIKHGNVTLKWGITDSTEIYDWFKLVQDAKTPEARRNVAIILMDEAGDDVNRWELENAWPIKYKSPDLNATSPAVAIENLDIAHEGMVRVK